MKRIDRDGPDGDDRTRRAEIRRTRRTYYLVNSLGWFANVLPMGVSVLLAQARGLSLFDVGIYTGAYALTVAVLEVPTGGLADTIGRKRTALLSYLLALVAMGVFLVAFTLPALLAYALVHGASRALGSGALEAWFVDSLQEIEPGVDLQPSLALAGTFELMALAAATLLGGFLPTWFADLDLGGAGVLTPLALPFAASALLHGVTTGAVALLVRERPPRVEDAPSSRPSGDGLARVVRDAIVLTRGNPVVLLLLGTGRAGLDRAGVGRRRSSPVRGRPAARVDRPPPRSWAQPSPIARGVGERRALVPHEVARPAPAPRHATPTRRAQRVRCRHRFVPEVPMAAEDTARPAHFENHPDVEISWLELFYDLIFVAAIIQLGSFLARNLNLVGALEFAFLSAVIWIAWSGSAFFFNRWLVEDVPLRLLVFAQIFTVGILAVLIGDAYSGGSIEFSVAVGIVHVIFVVLYLLVHHREPKARKLTGRYASGFGVVAAIWLASALVPDPYRYAIWVAALAVDFYMALSPGTRRLYPLLPLDVPRLSERFGQFTLIVLGESFITTVAGLADERISLDSVVFGAVAFTFIASVWWTYFQGIAGTVIREGASVAWAMWHAPLMVGIAAMGVGLREVVLLDFGATYDTAHRILLFGAVTLCLLTLTVLDGLGTDRRGRRGRGKILARLVPIALLVLLATVGLMLPTSLALGLGVLACLLQVVVEIRHHPHASTTARAVPAEYEG